MITLKEWAEFNRPVINQGDVIVKIFKHGSYNNNDQFLCSLMRFANAVELFGDLELCKFSAGQIQHETLGMYHTIKIVLWTNDDSGIIQNKEAAY